MDAFICKIVVIDTKESRNARPKTLENKQAKNSIKKCLFGVPDPADTDRMVQEQYEVDRKRFIDRFGIDLNQVDTIEEEYNDENIDTTAIDSRGVKRPHLESRKTLRAHRKALKLLSTQHVITGKLKYT